MLSRILQILTQAFPLWILAGASLALYHPPLFTWFSGPLIPLGLAVIMLGMGLTLEAGDFRKVFAQQSRHVWLGIFLQFTVMPFLGWLLGYLFKLPTPYAVGLVLVACCPGGTASNVVAFLAKANVPLSVTMTTGSTILAVLVTPMMTAFLAGSRVEVDALGLLISTFQVIILPVLAGLLMKRFLPALTRVILPAAPLAAVFFITLIVSSIVGAGRTYILECGWRLLGAVFSLHILGFLLGYLLSFKVSGSELVSRTVSIEVGMQNSGLGVVLSRGHFIDPAVAIPSAISSVFHSIIGSLLAAFWSRRAEKLEHRAA